MKAAVLIVTHNSEGHIAACLDAIPREAELAEILVIDNASTDKTAQEVRRFPFVRLIENTDNRGFAGAVNQGFRLTGADLVLLLNPDVAWSSGWADLVAAGARHGIACGVLLDGASGNAQRGFSIRRLPTAAGLAFECLGINRIWPGNPVNRKYRCLDMDFGIAQAVEQPAGAMLMIRRDVWEMLGGFDQQFHPVWFEDVDFCARAIAANVNPWFVPQASGVHVGGHSVATMSRGSRIEAWYGSLLKYAFKHFGCNTFRLVSASVAMGCGVRAAIGVVRGVISPEALTESVSYRAIVRLAGRSIWSGKMSYSAASCAVETGLAEVADFDPKPSVPGVAGR